MKILFGLLISYLLGSIPTGYIIVKKVKGLDIREHGSGNVGATNVFRILGKNFGFLVLFLDALKGVLAVTVVADLFGMGTILGRILAALAVVIGHNWTCFLGFKGGKGIATSLGVLIGFTIKIASIRIVLLVTILTWLVVFLLTRIVSISSIIAAVILPIIMVATYQPFELIVLGVIFALFVVFRHRPNIRRLLNGEEPSVPLKFLGNKKP